MFYSFNFFLKNLEQWDSRVGQPKILAMLCGLHASFFNFPEKTTALCAKGQGLRPGKLKFSLGKFSRPQSRGLSQVPKGSRPKQKKRKIGTIFCPKGGLAVANIPLLM
jgi:hypothetical protein